MPLTPTGFIGDVEEDPLRASIEWLWHRLLGANPEWSQGRLSISNKELSSEWIDDLQLPLAVACSHVGRLHVTLPSAVRAVDRSGNAAAAADAAAGSQWNSDDSCWFEVQVADVFAILKPVHPDDLEVDSHAILEKARCIKRQKLQALSKNLILPEQPAKKTAPFGLHTLLAHFRRQALGHLLRHASIDIQNVHLRYEDPVTSPRFVFSGGFFLKHLVVSNAPMPLPRDDGSQILRKRAVACLSMYWQSYDPEMFSNKTDWRTSMARQQDMRLSESDQASPHVHQVLPATDIKASFCSPCPKTGATISVEITVPKFVPCLTQAMIGDLVLLAQLHSHWHAWLQNGLSACARFRQLAPQQRPTSKPKAWWHHTVTFTRKLRRLREATRYWLTTDVQWQLRMHRVYLDLVEQEMLAMKAAAEEHRELALLPELDRALDQLEGSLPEELLALWRRQAAGHSSLPEEDLKLLGIRRRAAVLGVPHAGIGNVEMDVSVASERNAAGKALSSPQSSSQQPLELAVLVEAQRVGISFREIPVLHALHRVPFEIVSHRATTTNYQSQECPATHQVLGKPLRSISRSAGRLPWNAHRTIPETYIGATSAWACLGTGAPAHGPGRRPTKVVPGTKELEVTLQELRFQCKQTLSEAGMSPVTTSFIVQRVHAGRPGDAGKVTPLRLDYEVRTPLVSSHWVGEHIHALQATLHGGAQDRPSRLKVEFGHLKLSATPDNVEDVIFFSQELLPHRSGKEAYHMSFTKCVPLFPEASRAASLSCARSSFRNLEVSIHLSRLLLCGIGGCNNRAALTAEVMQGHASLKPEPNDVASQNAMPDDVQLHGKGSHNPWSLRTQFMLILSTSSRKAASCDTHLLGEGLEADETTCVDGRMLSKFSECVIGAAVTWHPCGVIGASAATEDAKVVSNLEVNIPHWKMHLEETYTMLTINQALGSLVGRLPQRLPRCLLSSRMKLWYPPRLTSMHQRSSMTKEGPGSSSEDEDRYDEARGHWSCDLWGELLEDGSMEIYSHPCELLPVYTLRIQEMRGGLSKQSTPVRRAQSRLTKEARELEVLVAVPEAAAASEVGSSPPMSARKGTGGALSAWVYIQCLDSLSDHWAWSWEAQIRSLRMGTSSCLARDLGGPYSGATSWRRMLVSSVPWTFRLNILRFEARVQTCFNAPVRSSCKSFTAEICGNTWHFTCSAEDVRVEDEGYAEVDQRRFLISALPDEFGSSVNAEKFFELSVSLAHGGCLRLASSHITVNPLKLRRLMHANGMFCELLNIISLSPILELGLSRCTAWISAAAGYLQSGKLQLSKEYIKAAKKTLKSFDEERFVFEIAPTSMDVICLQSFTALQVASWRLEGLSMKVACQPQCEFALESMSASVDTVLLSGVTGSSIIKAYAQEAPAPTAGGPAHDEDQACEHAASPFLKAACRRHFQGKEASAWCLSAASLSPWRITYYHADCCRLAEFATDVANACTWTFPEASTPSQGQLWPFAWWSGSQAPYAQVHRAEVESTSIMDHVEANIDLHLPSIYVPSSRVSEDTLPESVAEPWIEVALGHLHISSSFGDSKQTKDTNTPDFQRSYVIVAKWIGFLGITGQTRNISHSISPVDAETRDLLDDNPPELSSVQSQGCDMVLHVNAELQPTAEKVPQRLSMAVVSEGLTLSLPCSVLQVFFSNVALHAPACKAPAIPPRTSHASLLSRLQRLVGNKASSMNCWQVTVGAEITECLLEITDIADQACMRARLLGLHQGLSFHGDSGLLEEFDFNVETLSLESHQCKDWRSIFFLQRSRGQPFDVQATLSKEVREREATGTSVDDAAKVIIDAREVHVVAGSPRLHLDPILMAYCQYVACLAKGMVSESASVTRNAEFLQSAMLAQRRAEAMAAAYHQNLEEFALPPNVQSGGMKHIFSEIQSSSLQQSHATAAINSALTTHTVDFECGIFFVELPCPTSASLIHLAMRPVIAFKRETGFGELDISFKVDISECRVARSDAKGTHCIVSPFKLSVNLQYARLKTPTDAPSWQPLFSQVARAVVNLDDIAMNLAWQDVLSVLEWHYFLEPPPEVFDARFKELEAYAGLHGRWPLHEMQRMKDPAAMIMFARRRSPERSIDISSFLGSFRAYLESFTETCASFGGLTCIFHDSQGLACRLSVQPVAVQAGLFDFPGSLPADVCQPQSCTCRTKLTWELELWHSWTGVWEPVLEPCDLIMMFSVSSGNEILTVHCPSMRTCVKGQHIREARRRCSSAEAELKLAKGRWTDKRRAIWQSSQGDVRLGQPLAFASLALGPPTSTDDHDDHIPEENPGVKVGDAHWSSGQPMSSSEGSLLRVRNDTGCVFSIALVLEELSLQAMQNGNMIVVQDGEQLEIGCVGKIASAHLCLHSGDSQTCNATIEDIHMRCSAPVMRAFPTGWSDTLLWQEVSADAAGVCCRFHSPICVANQTPLVLEVKYEDEVEPCAIQPGDSRGLRLAHVHNVKELCLRLGTSGSSEWSRPIALETTFGSGYVLKCGTNCELVVEITSSGKVPGTKIHASCEQTNVVLSPRCILYNTLPIPLQVHVASSCASDATASPSTKFTVGPEQNVATMTVPAGGDELWIAIAREGQSVWSKVKAVQLRSVQKSSTILNLESDGGDAHDASILQVEVRSILSIRGRYLGPQVALGIFVSHLLVSHCPFALRVSARVDEHLRWMTPWNVVRDKEELQLWALPRPSFRLHGDPATGPVVATNTEDIPETGAAPARIGQYDVAVSRSHSVVSASVGISSLYLAVVPRFWIFSHLEFDVEARQVDREARLVDLAALVSIKALSGAVLHLPRQASVPTLVFRRRGVSSPAAWSGSIDICNEQRCTLALPDDTARPTGVLLIEVVQQPTGQLAIHLSLAEVPDYHIENHTSMQLQVHQVGREALGSCTLQPMTVLLWSWPDPAAAQHFSSGRPGPLQIKCDRWKASEWLSVNPQSLEVCSDRYSGVELTAHIRREGGMCIIAVTAFDRVKEDLRIPTISHLGFSQQRRHLRASCSDVSVSIVGNEAELFRLTLTGVVVGTDFLASSQTMLLSVATLKLDHLAPGAVMPAVIRTALPKRGLFFTAGCSWNLGLRSPSGVAPAPMLEASFLGQRQDYSLDCLDVHISELWISAHIRSLVTSLLALMEVVHSEVPTETSAPFAEVNSLFAPPWHTPQHVVIRELRLSPVVLQLQVSMLNFDIGSLDHLGQQFEAARRVVILLSGRDFHTNRLSLRELVADEVTGSMRSVWELLKTHYGYAICHQALCTMCAGGGGADLSGGSEGRRVMKHLSESLEHFFRAPLSPTGPSQSSEQAEESADGAQKPVLQVMGSMGRGTVSLLSRTAQGARHSVAHVSRFFGRSIVLMSLDSEFEAEMANPQFQHSSHFTYGLDSQPKPLNSLISQVGCWRAPPMANQESLLGCSSNAHVCGEEVETQAPPVFGAGGYASFMESPQNARWQLFASWLKPLASFLGLDSPPSDSTSEDVFPGAEDDNLDSLPDFSLPPPPRLLLGPHRLLTRHNQKDGHLRRLLDLLAEEVGRSICYEDHCAALEHDCFNLLTDSELLVIRCSGFVRVERRWALDGVTPMSVRADGSLVRFSAELGVSGALEISIGSGEIRCINVAAADRFANSIQRVAIEAQFRRVPQMLGAQHAGQNDKTVVSL